MTWKELCEKAKEMGAGIGKKRIYFGKLEFDYDGHIYLDPYYLDDQLYENFYISSDRTYDQMYQIMEAFRWENGKNQQKESPNETSNSN